MLSCAENFDLPAHVGLWALGDERDIARRRTHELDGDAEVRQRHRRRCRAGAGGGRGVTEHAAARRRACLQDVSGESAQTITGKPSETVLVTDRVSLRAPP